MPRLCLILFGSPGSGKGTQAKLLKESLGIAHISTGDMLRERVASGDEIGRAVASLMQAGELVPDETVNRLVEERIDQPDCVNGFILDGYPRTVDQAKLLAELLVLRPVRTMVVHLVVDYNVIIARISGRRQCPACGALYGVTSSTPRISGVCDQDGTQLVVRDDDREDVVRERLRAYEQQTAPVLAFFRKSGVPTWDVPAAEVSPQAIAKSIEALIRRDRGEAA
ncbi:MAG TPA: adenylate kinase [Bryobacteraceae bacterium]|jgi:adenylate kinase|nr:adenylate kinase [Bryobacteraceae bacterium]